MRCVNKITSDVATMLATNPNTGAVSSTDTSSALRAETGAAPNDSTIAATGSTGASTGDSASAHTDAAVPLQMIVLCPEKLSMYSYFSGCFPR